MDNGLSLFFAYANGRSKLMPRTFTTESGEQSRMAPLSTCMGLHRFMCDALHACSCSELGPVASQTSSTLSNISLDYSDLSGLAC